MKSVEMMKDVVQSVEIIGVMSGGNVNMIQNFVTMVINTAIDSFGRYPSS